MSRIEELLSKIEDNELQDSLRQEIDAEMDAAYEDGRSDADDYDSGFEAGKEEGYDDGFEAGKEEGYDDGYSNGREEGYEDGYATGFSDDEDNCG